MCDYSLHSVKSRPAKVGDKLTTRYFGTGTRGFAARSISATRWNSASSLINSLSSHQLAGPKSQRAFHNTPK